ncbi:MAG TPA: cyclic nucleotide-binding domain-containing protein, partial [Actinomycetota bacterium]|nr:cyclic nucleotide-binding domain-containing protein [Actinomycetota bacterium]
MRIESSVTSISWIPSEAVSGLTKLPFETGIAHYDDPPPEILEDLEELRVNDRFRFANQLSAYVDVEDGIIVGYGSSGEGHIGSTTMRLAGRDMTFAAVALPDIKPPAEVHKDRVRFVQTSGGRTGAPAPRRVSRKPFIQLAAPLAWTTLALTLHADGRSEFEVVGASPFPRHWIYDHEGKLAAKSGLIDFKTWYRDAFGDATPWGSQDSPALVTAAETALERELSATIMSEGQAPKIRKLKVGAFLVKQGDLGTDLFLLLDGVLAVQVDGDDIAQVGPGALLGERALLEEGVRTSSLRALTPVKVAVVAANQVSKTALLRIRT